MSNEQSVKRSRGMRLCNPGNIRRGRSKWHGLTPWQSDPSFCQFQNLTYGYRALWILLSNYWHIHGLCQIKRIVNYYAPPCENNVERYISALCSLAGVGASQVLPPPQNDAPLWERIVVAITCIEQGMRKEEVPVDTIREAYRRAFGLNG